MSDDDRDDSRKVGLWVVFSSVAVLLLGVLGFAVVLAGVGLYLLDRGIGLRS